MILEWVVPPNESLDVHETSDNNDFFSGLAVENVETIHRVDVDDISCFCWPSVVVASDLMSDDTILVGTKYGKIYAIKMTPRECELRLQQTEICTDSNPQGN